MKRYVDGINRWKEFIITHNDILDLSKIEAGHLNIIHTPVNINNLSNEFKQLFGQRAEEKGINFCDRNWRESLAKIYLSMKHG